MIDCQNFSEQGEAIEGQEDVPILSTILVNSLDQILALVTIHVGIRLKN